MAGVVTDPYTQALALTLLIEGAFLAPWLARSPDKIRAFMVFVGVNCLTHGLLWSLFAHLPWAYPVSVAIAEAAIIAVEASLFYAMFNWSAQRATTLSTLANGLSTLIGLLVALPR